MRLLRRWHFSRMLATVGTLLIAVAVLAAIGWFVGAQAMSNSQELTAEVKTLLDKAQEYAKQSSVVGSIDLQGFAERVTSALEKNSAVIAKDVLTAGSAAAETLTGLIILVFVAFFFLAEGDKIWTWIVRLVPHNAQPSILGAGYRAWKVLSGWITGIAIIAAFHGLVIGISLAILGVPLAVPLAVLVFLGSFIPVVGVLVFGGLSVLVTLISQGWVFALVLLGVILVTDQIEAHILQPFIVGRAVKLHPIAIALSLTGGALIAGVFGAIVAVPVIAALHAAVKYLTGIEDLNGVVRRGEKDRMTPEAPREYAPLPFYDNPISRRPGSPEDDSVCPDRVSSGSSGDEESDVEIRSDDNGG